MKEKTIFAKRFTLICAWILEETRFDAFAHGESDWNHFLLNYNRRMYPHSNQS